MAELTGKTISELPEATGIQDTDLIAISRNASSMKMFIGTLLENVRLIAETVSIDEAATEQQIGSVTNAKITSNTQVVWAEVEDPLSQVSNWTITTYDESPQLRITGICSSETTVKLILAQIESV